MKACAKEWDRNFRKESRRGNEDMKNEMYFLSTECNERNVLDDNNGVKHSFILIDIAYTNSIRND
jgi:hypothetical protein